MAAAGPALPPSPDLEAASAAAYQALPPAQAPGVPCHPASYAAHTTSPCPVNPLWHPG